MFSGHAFIDNVFNINLLLFGFKVLCSNWHLWLYGRVYQLCTEHTPVTENSGPNITYVSSRLVYKPVIETSDIAEKVETYNHLRPYALHTHCNIISYNFRLCACSVYAVLLQRRILSVQKKSSLPQCSETAEIVRINNNIELQSSFSPLHNIIAGLVNVVAT